MSAAVDCDVVPGTVYLIEGSHQAGAPQEILLLPVPSSDLKDPLRWSTWRKTYHLVLLVTYSSLMGALTNWDAVAYLNLVDAYQTTVSQLNYGAAGLILMLGVGNVILLPLSNKYGRRAVYLWTMVVVLSSYIWLTFSQTIGDSIGGHILCGFGAAPFEALVAISIADIYFAHERGGKLGYYVFGLAFGSFIGPICAGYMVTNQGDWRWIYRWGTVLTAALIVLFYFTFEETRYVRPAESHEGRIVTIEEPTKSASPSRADNFSKDANKDVKVDATLGEELHREWTNAPTAGQVFETDSFSIQYSFWKTFPTSWSGASWEIYSPLPISLFPAVLWCGIQYGTCVSWLAVLGTTVAEVFAIPPYNFSNSDLGLVYISPMIGSLIGAYISGPLNDRLTLWLSNRNKGWREPEFRLWPFIPSSFIMAGGLIIYGATSANGLPWIVPVVGMGLVGFGLSVGGTLSIAYTVDCYKEIDTQAVTTVILIRNIIGFGITFGIQPWIDGMGQQNCFIFVGVLAFVITAFAAVFLACGKKMRRWTASRYAKLAAESMKVTT